MIYSPIPLSSLLLALLSLCLVQLCLLGPAVANTVTGMPWETPLQKIKNSLTGPVALCAWCWSSS